MNELCAPVSAAQTGVTPPDSWRGLEHYMRNVLLRASKRSKLAKCKVTSMKAGTLPRSPVSPGPRNAWHTVGAQ